MRVRGFPVLIPAAVALLAAACASRVVPVPVVTTPRYPDFIAPAIPAELRTGRAAQAQARAWTFLQAGDLGNAEREVQAARRASAAFYPAEATAGYVALARNTPQDALIFFDRALQSDGKYTSALAGRGEALLALNREGEALSAFEAVLAIDPSLSDLQRRIEVLRFRGLERELMAARQAATDGRLDAAAQAYRMAIARSPESAFLHRELAAIERRRGDIDGAIEQFRRAAALDPSDAGSLADVARLLESRGDLEAALRAYDESLAIERSTAVETSREALRTRIELLSLPAEYRAIETAAQATRADLAALIGVRLGPLLQSGQPLAGVVLTDVRAHWAEGWMIAVARAGVMEAFANHTFQPSGLVRRADLADVVVRLLPRAAPEQAKTWQNAGRTFSDLARGHLAYPAASAAVASGVLAVGPNDSFQPSRAITGAEAAAAIAQVRALADAAAGRRADGR